MWFGTEDGLNKFDGQNFKVYRHKETDSTSIGRGPVIDIIKDKTGNIWLATNFTLSVYNLNLDSFINYDFTNYGWITCLYADHDDKIWVGTYSGLFLFDPKTQKTVSFKSNPNDYTKLNTNVINCIYETTNIISGLALQTDYIYMTVTLVCLDAFYMKIIILKV
jgi:ligand-binding sensor domain-containing protein